MSLECVTDQLKKRTVLRTAETMTEHHHRTSLPCFQFWFLDDGSELTVITVDAHLLSFGSRRIGSRCQFLQILVHFVGKYGRELYLPIRTDHHHRGNPVHAIGLRDVSLLELLQFAYLRIGNAILLNSLLPSFHISIHRYTQELDTILFIGIVHTHHLGGILPAVRTPGSPEVEHHGLALCPFGKLELLTVGLQHLEVRCCRTRLDQFGCILAVWVLLWPKLRLRFHRHSHQERHGK